LNDFDVYIQHKTDINIATGCVLRAYNAAKCDCGWGSAPHSAGGVLPQAPKLVLRQPLRDWKEGKGGD